MHIQRWIFLGVVLMAAGYFFYEARGVIFAPKLEIFEPALPASPELQRGEPVGRPQDGETISSSRFHIAGRTKPYLKVWISGREVQADEKGIFEDNIPVWPGLNQIGIKVSDKFGNETKKILRIVVE